MRPRGIAGVRANWHCPRPDGRHNIRTRDLGCLLRPRRWYRLRMAVSAPAELAPPGVERILSVQPVLSSPAAVESPGPGASGGALSPPDSRPVVVMPLSSTMLVIRSAVLLACLVLVPALALVGVSWLDHFRTDTTAESVALEEDAQHDHAASELDELQQLAGMTGVATEDNKEQPLRIPPTAVPAFFGEQTPAQKPYWEQGAGDAQGEVEAAVAQAKTPMHPRITGVTMADGTAPPVQLAAGQYPPAQQPAGQGATAQATNPNQLADSQAATPRRPWATRAADHPPQGTAHSQAIAQPQAQGMAQNQAMTQPQATPQTPAQPHAAAQPIEGVAHVSSVPQAADGQGTLQAMIARLRGLGAAYFRLENWGQLSYFRCEMPLKDDPRYHAYFEATNADPILAVREVLDKIEKWQAQQSSGAIIASPPQQPGGPMTR